MSVLNGIIQLLNQTDGFGSLNEMEMD